MKARIIQFRRGNHTVHERHFLIEIHGVTTRAEAEKFVGKDVDWKSPAGKIIHGKIAAEGKTDLEKRCLVVSRYGTGHAFKVLAGFNRADFWPDFGRLAMVHAPTGRGRALETFF